MIDALLEGNRRFQAGVSDHCTDRAVRRLALIDSQHPSVAVLSCADSRVDPDVVFDVGLGEIFSVRVAGGLASPDAVASLRFAVNHLNVRIVVVLGHEGCGAVDAARGPVSDDPHIELLLEPIRRALSIAPEAEPVRRNTCSQAGVVRAAMPAEVAVIAAVYTPSTGAIHIHDVVTDSAGSARSPLPT